MARRLIDVTQTYQVFSKRPARLTINKVGEGNLFVNDAADDSAAEIYTPTEARPGYQIAQTNYTKTYIRAAGDGWRIVVDD